MNAKIFGLALFALTLGTVVFYPYTKGNTAISTGPAPVRQPLLTQAIGAPMVEVVFVLDTTGSMEGLIQAAKDKIWSIATTMASAQPAPRIRMGLVGYRDRGDQYVTRTVDLSEDLDSVYAALMDFQAGGGGDTPESVNQALHEAIHGISWSQGRNAYKVVFLVGDAPPHMDYQDDVPYPQSLADARQAGIVVNTIQCGQMGETVEPWQHIAQLGQGRFFQVEQAGGAVAIATPFDRELAELSAALDATRLYYGSGEEQAMMRMKVAATDKMHAAASDESRARRAAFNASAAGEANLLGSKELVDDVASGRVDLDAIEEEALPAPLQPMAPEARKELIAESARKREALRRQIGDLSQERDEYVAKKLAEAGGTEHSLDQKIYEAVKEQAEAVGLAYAEGPKH
ncbi:MAG TPA: vWA domain-containing protein [Gammaproteobacteria bacterium]|nr:vWA domain-containing protein [Gammaproteobacteria bacterium]